MRPGPRPPGEVLPTVRPPAPPPASSPPASARSSSAGSAARGPPRSASSGEQVTLPAGKGVARGASTVGGDVVSDSVRTYGESVNAFIAAGLLAGLQNIGDLEPGHVYPGPERLQCVCCGHTNHSVCFCPFMLRCYGKCPVYPRMSIKAYGRAAEPTRLTMHHDGDSAPSVVNLTPEVQDYYITGLDLYNGNIDDTVEFLVRRFPGSDPDSVRRGLEEVGNNYDIERYNTNFVLYMRDKLRRDPTACGLWEGGATEEPFDVDFDLRILKYGQLQINANERASGAQEVLISLPPGHAGPVTDPSLRHAASSATVLTMSWPCVLIVRMRPLQRQGLGERDTVPVAMLPRASAPRNPTLSAVEVEEVVSKGRAEQRAPNHPSGVDPSGGAVAMSPGPAKGVDTGGKGKGVGASGASSRGSSGGTVSSGKGKEKGTGPQKGGKPIKGKGKPGGKEKGKAKAKGKRGYDPA